MYTSLLQLKYPTHDSQCIKQKPLFSLSPMICSLMGLRLGSQLASSPGRTGGEASGRQGRWSLALRQEAALLTLDMCGARSHLAIRHKVIHSLWKKKKNLAAIWLSISCILTSTLERSPNCCFLRLKWWWLLVDYSLRWCVGHRVLGHWVSTC